MPVEAKPLFRPNVLRPYPAAFPLPERVQAHRPALARWAELFASGQADQFKEHELLHDFLTEIFCGLVGYTRLVDNNERCLRGKAKLVNCRQPIRQGSVNRTAQHDSNGRVTVCRPRVG